MDYYIYTVVINGVTWYALHTPESEENNNFDDVFRTEDEAKSGMERQIKHDEQRKIDIQKRLEREAKEKQEREILEYCDGFTDNMTALQKGKAVKVLISELKVNGVFGTLKDHVKKLIANGAIPFTKEIDKIQPMSRMAYFRADDREQREHERKQKEAGKKTIYCFRTSENSYIELGKIAHDYGQFLINLKEGMK